MNDESFRDLQRQTVELAGQITRLVEVVDQLVRDQGSLAKTVNSTNPTNPGVSMRVDRIERRNQFLFGTNIVTSAAVFLLAWKLAWVWDKMGGM